VEVIKTRTQLLGTSWNIQVADAYHNLGIAQEQCDKLVEAEQSYKTSYFIKQKVLPKNHMSIATTLNNLSILLWKMNKHEDCLAQLRRALEIAQGNNMNTGENLKTAAMMMNLGMTILKKVSLTTRDTPSAQNNTELLEAQELLERALEVKKDLLSETHPAAVAQCYANLGCVLRKKGSLSSAVEHFQEAVAIQRSVCARKKSSEVSQDLARCLFQLGMVQCMQEKEENKSEGRKNLAHALEVHEEVQKTNSSVNPLDADEVEDAERLIRERTSTWSCRRTT